MEFLKIIAVIMVCVCVSYAYDTQHDNVDLAPIVKDKAKLRGFLDCLRNVQPCNSLTQHYKDDFGDAIMTGCVKCTAEQVRNARLLVLAFDESYPAELNALVRSVDPELKAYPKFRTNIGL